MSQGCVTCQRWSHVKGGHMSKVVTCQRWSHVKGGHMSQGCVTCHMSWRCRGDVVAMSWRCRVTERIGLQLVTQFMSDFSIIK